MISVVVPTIGRKEVLWTKLHMLALSIYKAFEVIVVDESEDGTGQLIKSFEWPFALTHIRNPDPGISRARNLGLIHAKGDIILNSDDDALPLPHTLGVFAWRTKPGTAVMGYFSPSHHSRQGEHFSWRDVRCANFAVHRKDALDAGGFDTQLKGYACEDVDWAYRLHTNGVEIVYEANAGMLHLCGVPYNCPALDKAADIETNEAYLAKKHGPLWEQLTVAPLGSLIRRTA